MLIRKKHIIFEKICRKKHSYGKDSKKMTQIYQMINCLLVKVWQLLSLIQPRTLRRPSSETQGQIVGARESLNGRKNMARRKVKNGEKSPWGQCLTRQVPNGRRRSGF